MPANTEKPYAVTDDVWERISPAASEAGREERRPVQFIALAFVAIIFVALFVSWVGLLSPDVVLLPAGGASSNISTHKGDVDLDLRNRGILTIEIDGPAKVDLPGVIVDRVTTRGPVRGVSLTERLLQNNDADRGISGILKVEFTVTSCDAVTDYINKLRIRNGWTRSVGLAVRLTVPVRIWRGRTEVTLDDAIDGGSTLLGGAIADACGTDLNNLPRRTKGPVDPAQIPGEFVRIRPGTFMTGYKTKGPATITEAFEIGKYEVTQAQWRAVMGTEPSMFEGDDLPVEMVSWDEAQEYLKKLNERNDGYRYRLPTGPEWEYAARAGSSEEPNLEAVAWHKSNSGNRTHPVGTKQPNAWGLYDMVGNVQEWVEEWWDEPSTGPHTDFKDMFHGVPKDERGGSFLSEPMPSQISFRRVGPVDRNAHSAYRGFRVAREPVR